MTSLLTIVEPFSSPYNAQFYGLLLISIISSVISILLLTNKIGKKWRLKGLFGMLCGFFSIVSLGAVILSAVHARQIQPLVFEKDHVTYGNNEIEYKKIDRHYVKPLFQQSRYSSELNTDTALVYVIEMRDKSLHILSSEYYDMQSLKSAMDEYKSKE